MALRLKCNGINICTILAVKGQARKEVVREYIYTYIPTRWNETWNERMECTHTVITVVELVTFVTSVGSRGAITTLSPAALNRKPRSHRITLTSSRRFIVNHSTIVQLHGNHESPRLIFSLARYAHVNGELRVQTRFPFHSLRTRTEKQFKADKLNLLLCILSTD